MCMLHPHMYMLCIYILYVYVHNFPYVYMLLHAPIYIYKYLHICNCMYNTSSWGIGTLPGSNLAFDEGIVRAELPLSRHSGGVVDAVVGKGALHLLSTGGG